MPFGPRWPAAVNTLSLPIPAACGPARGQIRRASGALRAKLLRPLHASSQLANPRAVETLSAAHAAAAPADRSLDAPERRPQHRHHRPRRPRQDDAGGPPPADDPRLPRQPAGRRARARQQRPGARARHHHPREEHLDPLPRHEDQRHRHARATPTSAARSSACSRWPTARCSSSTRSRARCRRRGSCSRRRSSTG